jgi:hypothetical protein
MAEANEKTPSAICQACGRAITGRIFRFTDVPTSAFCSLECQISKTEPVVTELQLVPITVTHATSPGVPNPVRPPNADERKQLADWLLSTGAYDPEDARLIVEAAYVAVFDSYCTGGPGYVGKVISVVWDGAPSMFDVFVWQNGTMERSGREYDQKACDRCGGMGGTLCWNCWRDEAHGLRERHRRAP